MPRIARMIIKGKPAVYHVVSRTALDGYVLGDVEKDYLLGLIKKLSSVYFAEVLGFSLMGNHFHVLVRMHPGDTYSDREIKRRYKLYCGDDKKQVLSGVRTPYFRQKWGSLPEYVREIKQSFTRFYNKSHNRKGFFWSERFKSVIVDNGDTLINCLAYIDLNPVRAGIVEKPEKYRWCSLGYHVQTRNEDDFLSLDFGLREFAVKDARARLRYYRRFVNEKGSMKTVGKERPGSVEAGRAEPFTSRSRYFTDSGIIGTKAFVNRQYKEFKAHFSSKHEKRPKRIKGLEGIYSLKRLSEKL